MTQEVYLLQTRLQKMPYKHIAAHLKKTELACRLHYHQLSHGSNRRKRTTSVSSGSSTAGHSPILPASVPSPIHEDSRSPSPPGSAGSYGPGSAVVQLPSILTGAAMSGVTTASPRLPTILPKPVSMTLALVAASPSIAAARGYPTPLHDIIPHSAPLLPAANFVPTPTTATAPGPPHSATLMGSSSSSSTTPNLPLHCSGLPPPSSLQPASAGPHHPVDMSRLQAIYAAHRSSFWTAIASEYGPSANPAVLEQAWRGSGSCLDSGIHHHHQHHHHHLQSTPLTPGTSPDDREATFYGGRLGHDKTRISAILGIDANPRSPKEREMVRRLEERVTVPAAA